ncbi:MAG: N-acetylmuramidase domain-containing protein, partial [Nitrospiraceae bacterium]
MPTNALQAKEKTGLVTASTLNVRPDPSTRRPPVGQLKRGARVTILRGRNGWFQIKAGPIEGYVYGDYVSILDERPDAGFLVEQEGLKTVGLEPPVIDRIDLTPKFSGRQKLVARTWNSQGGLLATLSDIIGVDVATAVAVLCVESSGRAFAPDGWMIIRFENHVFWRQWGKRNTDVFDTHFRFHADKAWTHHQFRDKKGGRWVSFHGSQAHEWRVFEFARALHEPAAMRSISMGGPQIMGFNHARIGYDSVGEMFRAFQAGIRYQILGLFDFLKGSGTSSPMVVALQRKKFEDFASRYNGPGQAAKYGELIENHF